MTGWFTAHRNYLRRLAAWLAGFDVRSVVYFRQPEDLAISLYKEHVVRRLLAGDELHFASFLAMTAPYYEYSRHVDALRDALGDVVVRDYAAAHRIGLQADFAALVGARQPAAARPLRRAQFAGQQGDALARRAAGEPVAPRPRSPRHYSHCASRRTAPSPSLDRPRSGPIVRPSSASWIDTAPPGTCSSCRCRSGVTCPRRSGRRTITPSQRPRSAIGRCATSTYCGGARRASWRFSNRIRPDRFAIRYTREDAIQQLAQRGPSGPDVGSGSCGIHGGA